MSHSRYSSFTTILVLVLTPNLACQDQSRSSQPSNSANTSASSSGSNPAPTATPESTMVQNLAIIEGVQRDQTKVSRIRTLLAQLDERYPENQQQIGDMTAAAYDQIQKKGHSASIIGIMEAMMTASEAKTKVTYADAVTTYILLRLGGMK